MLSVFLKLFVDVNREVIRKRLKRSRFADFFWHSDVNDYSNLRFVINFTIGLVICFGLYYMTWKRINFLDFNVYTSYCFQFAIIFGSSLAFAKNAIFRCAIICVCLGALGRTGQGIFSLFVLERLSDGPIDNLVYNFEMTSRIVVCHLEIQSKITAHRISLAAGPVEELLEKHLGKSVSVGQKIIHTLKSLIEPFNSDLKTDSAEDDVVASIIDNAQALSDRQFLVKGGGYMLKNKTQTNFNNNDTVLHPESRPVWARYKSILARAVSRRFMQRCESMFSSAVKSCHENFENAQSLCYEKAPAFFGFFICRHFNSLALCKPGETISLYDKYCAMGSELEMKNPLSPSLDEQLESIHNISKQITSQLQLNLHFQAIEEPVNEKVRELQEIKAEIKSDVYNLKVALNTFKDILSAFLVLLLYWIFRDTLKIITNYLNDFEFQNNFITADFWYIDTKRMLKGKEYFGKENFFCLLEAKKFHLQTSFAFPSFSEAFGSYVPILRWIILCCVAFIVVMLDHYFYRILMLVFKYGKTNNPDTRSTFAGSHTLEINVKGEGPIADIIKNILNFNFTRTARNDLTNEMCLTMPRSPDWIFIFLWIKAPLFFMLFFQMIFNVILSRITIIYIIGFVFQKRARARTIYLYKKILAARVKQKHSQRIRSFKPNLSV